MGENSSRKMPSDRPGEDKDSAERSKKSKKEIKEDAIMSNKMIDAEECEEKGERRYVNPQLKAPEHQVSYKDSLLGFKSAGYNGVVHGSSDMEDDSLLSDLLDQTWKILGPSEELKKLMEVYPVVPITLEEYSEACQPWNNALIITVLGTRFHLFKLKERLSKIWNFSDFDLPNNYFVV